MEDNLKKKMEEDLKKKEDNHQNGRWPQTQLQKSTLIGCDIIVN